MKYQQLENLEAGWKWQYLLKKHQSQVKISRFIDSSEAEVSVNKLLQFEHDPEGIENWIIEEMNPELGVKLGQAIRAKRKRYFNAEHKHTKKKSIDLEYIVWEKLSERANQLGATLSDTIEYLLTEEAQAEELSNFEKDNS